MERILRVNEPAVIPAVARPCISRQKKKKKKKKRRSQNTLRSMGGDDTDILIVICTMFSQSSLIDWLLSFSRYDDDNDNGQFLYSQRPLSFMTTTLRHKFPSCMHTLLRLGSYTAQYPFSLPVSGSQVYGWRQNPLIVGCLEGANFQQMFFFFFFDRPRYRWGYSLDDSC